MVCSIQSLYSGVGRLHTIKADLFTFIELDMANTTNSPRIFR